MTLATKDTAATLQPREGLVATRPRLIDLHLCSLHHPRGSLRKRNDVLPIRVPAFQGSTLRNVGVSGATDLIGGFQAWKATQIGR